MAGIGVNEVDYLLSNPFSSMSLGEKVEVKKVGAHHPKDIQITQKEKLQNRSFCVTWFERKDMLMASLAKIQISFRNPLTSTKW